MLARFLFILPFTALLFSGCTKFHKLQKSENIDKKYEAAVNYYKEEDYYKASVLLESIVPLLSGTERAEKALYYFANCYFEQEKYSLSAHYFKDFFSSYSRSQYTKECTYKYAMSLYNLSPQYNLDQSKTYQAIDAARRYIRKYPEAKHVDKCRKILRELNQKLVKKAFYNARLYYKIGLYKAAVEAMTDFTKSYKNTKYSEEAAFIKLKSQYKIANLSIKKKKDQRLQKTIDLYNAFVDQYPKSKYISEAEKIYEDSKEAIKNFKSS